VYVWFSLFFFPPFLVSYHPLQDYAGKGMFQTLGNTLANQSTGLLFIDFEKGPALQLTGSLIVEWMEEDQSLDGTDRLVIFTGTFFCYLFFFVFWSKRQ
jgi:hypothetical protein